MTGTGRAAGVGIGLAAHFFAMLGVSHVFFRGIVPKEGNVRLVLALAGSAHIQRVEIRSEEVRAAVFRKVFSIHTFSFGHFDNFSRFLCNKLHLGSYLVFKVKNRKAQRSIAIFQNFSTSVIKVCGK